MAKASIYTLGCKLNHFESVYITQSLKDMGCSFVRFPSFSDIFVINTCAVTAKSEKHSFHAIRRAIRSNARGIIIATGCVAQINPGGIESIKGVDLILGNSKKHLFNRFLNSLKKGGKPEIIIDDYKDIEKNVRQPLSPMVIDGFPDYTRAFVKIQEGCDSHCSYCIVPKARGPARSVKFDSVVNQAQRLWSAGYHEIVLTGIHIGQYGKDLIPKTELSDLLDVLFLNIGKNRLRLSSIEPNEINKGLLNHISSSGALCPHFHIPLQSGSRKILSKMGRGYSPERYAEIISNIISRNPIASIGADVIVGFPGETEEEFRLTYNLVDSLPLSYLHVFSFSPRPGTAAAYMPNQTESLIKKRRGLLLRNLGNKKRQLYYSGFIGKRLEALIINQRTRLHDCRTALTTNYIPICVDTPVCNINKQVIVKIKKISGHNVFGEIVSFLE